MLTTILLKKFGQECCSKDELVVILSKSCQINRLHRLTYKTRLISVRLDQEVSAVLTMGSLRRTPVTIT
jgi:hypothetical protein